MSVSCGEPQVHARLNGLTRPVIFLVLCFLASSSTLRAEGVVSLAEVQGHLASVDKPIDSLYLVYRAAVRAPADKRIEYVQRVIALKRPNRMIYDSAKGGQTLDWRLDAGRQQTHLLGDRIMHM